MFNTIELSEDQQKEVLAFFKAKREQQAKELATTEEIINKLEGKPLPAESKQDETIPETGRGAIVPLKYKIDEVLKASPEPMSARNIMNGLIKLYPNEYKSTNTLRKTVASALAQNSKNQKDRYAKTLKMGLNYFFINKDYKEKQ